MPAQEWSDIPLVMNLLIRQTRNNRAKFPPERARSMFDAADMLGGELPRRGGGGGGGSRGGQGLAAWQLPRPKVLRGVVVGGRITQRLCTVFTARAAV